jgi:hypothetical protein
MKSLPLRHPSLLADSAATGGGPSEREKILAENHILQATGKSKADVVRLYP